MAKIPQKFMGMLGKFAESLDYNDLPKGWADNPEIVSAAGELYRDMGTESPFFKAWFGNWPAAKAYNDAVSASPVITLTGREFQKDGVPLTQKVPAWYDDTFQGAVRSPQLGEVRLDLEGVKDSLGHGIGREKSAAFAAVPDIIRKGTVFDRQSNWKGGGYDTSVISAPVRIGDTDYAGEVVVKHLPNRQGLYLHEVENRKRLEDAFKTANGSAPQASRLILGQKFDDVKRSSKVVDGEGMPLLVYHETDDAFDTLSKAKSHDGGFSFTEKPDPQGSSGQEFYLKGTYGLPEKRAARRAGLPVQDLDYVHVPDKGYWVVKEPTQIKSVQNRGTFNPDDPNIYRALPWAVGGAGTAAALSPDEAEAAPRPKYMEELVEKLKTGDYMPMDFGNISGGQLKKLQGVDPAFTEGPLKLSGKNIEKFARKRIGENGLSPEELADGLNSVFYGSRSRVFPAKDGKTLLLSPGEEYSWKGVLAPHDHFSGLVTGHKYHTEDAKKELEKLSEVRPLPHVPHPVKGSDAQPGRFSAVESDSKLFEDSNIPAIDTIRKGMLPLFAGGVVAALSPDEAEASVPDEDYRARAIPADEYPWPADEPGYVNREPGLGTPLVDVADLAVAPIGAATAAGRAASVAAEPFLAYGMDKAGNWLGDKIGGLLGYFGWGD